MKVCKNKGIIYYYLFFFKTNKLRKTFRFYKILSIEDTIKQIIREKKNISRFGDGEFRLVLGKTGIGFQKKHTKLTEKLREVLISDNNRVLIALPETFALFNGINYTINYWWLNYINNVGIHISKYIKNDKKYGNSFISRFYLEYKNQNKKRIDNVLNHLKKIWEGRDVLIIEGKYSRLGVGNDLFDNTKSIQRILCPEKNAFDKYDEIFEAAKKFGKGKLILLALGPTATVMAYDLAKEDFWALDIGHIDLEYMWYLMGATKKSPIVGRLVNETNTQLSLEIPEEHRETYYKSVITQIL